MECLNYSTIDTSSCIHLIYRLDIRPDQTRPSQVLHSTQQRIIMVIVQRFTPNTAPLRVSQASRTLSYVVHSACCGGMVEEWEKVHEAGRWTGAGKEGWRASNPRHRGPRTLRKKIPICTYYLTSNYKVHRDTVPRRGPE